MDAPTTEDYRAGFVSVVGRPNVGKSTLVNRLIGQKIAIVSPKPQTTRNRLLGVLTLARAQIAFLDTPGIHVPLHTLGAVMVQTAAATLPEGDVILWVVDVSQPPNEEDRRVAALLAEARAWSPVVLGLNKCDRLSATGGESVQDRVSLYEALAPQAQSLLISAVRGDNLEELVALLGSLLPFSPPLFPEEQVTDQQVRFMAGELVREQVLLRLRDEVPHAVAVFVSDFKERSDALTVVSAVIYVERASQKMILLGRDGRMIKQIGQGAREQIEELLGTRVYLDLWVKVRPKWRSREEELRRLGYPIPKNRPARATGPGAKRR